MILNQKKIKSIWIVLAILVCLGMLIGLILPLMY